MNKMTRIVSGILAIMLIITFVYTSIAQAAEPETKEFLSELAVMQGDSNGNFNDNHTLTREEFAKIVVAIADHDYIALNSTSPFFDVPSNRWSAGYIERANTLGILYGYPDGSFRPSEQVLPEQVCKAMLSMLGYDNSHITANWAQSQIEFAKAKGLLDGVSYQLGVPITRIETAKIVKNALLSQKKDSANYLISDMGYSYYKDTVIVSDKNAAGNYVTTSSGTFSKGNLSDDAIYAKGKLIVNSANEIVAFLPEGQTRKDYVVKAATGDSINVFGKNGNVTITMSYDTIVYDGANTLNYKAALESVSLGDKISVFTGENGTVQYAGISRNALDGPYTNISGSFEKYVGLTENSTIIRNGEKSTLDAVSDYDICYYADEADTVLIYTNKQTGVYEEAIPNKDNPTSVKISGKIYEIESTTAFNKLSSNGNIKYGDAIKILTGKNGKIADVIAFSENDNVNGYFLDSVLSTRTDENGKEYTGYNATVILTDGSVQQYYTGRDYNNYVGKVVRVKFTNGNATINTVTSNNSISGTFDWNRKKLGSYTLSDDIKIIDVANDSQYSKAKGKAIYPQRIAGNNLSGSSILYAKTENKEITELILNDYTNDLYDYGVVLYAKNLSNEYMTAGDYKINVSGRVSEFKTGNVAYAVNTGTPAVFDIDAEKGLISMKSLNAVQGAVKDIDELYVYTNSGRHRLSDNVLVYRKVSSPMDGTGARYEIIPIEDINEEDSLSAYCDKTETSGGRVRVIVVK